jgi:hypothetical protein
MRSPPILNFSTSLRGSLHGATRLRERRQHPRIPLAIEATIIMDDGSQLHGTTRDVGMGGIFVEIQGTFVFGVKVQVEVKLPKYGTTLLPGTIRWIEPIGVGIQFGLLGAKDTHGLSELLKGKT